MALTRIQPSALDKTLNYTANTFTANYITFGDGTSQKTAAQTKFTKTLTSTAPSNPIEGDTWYDTTTGVWSLYVAAGNGVTSSGWIEIGRP